MPATIIAEYKISPRIMMMVVTILTYQYEKNLGLTPNYVTDNGVEPVSTLIIFPSFTKRTSITAFLPDGPSSIE
jgi:hypothetical protein